MKDPATDPYRIHVNPVGPEAPRELLVQAVRATLRSESVAEAEVSVTLLDDAGMRDLNRRYLARDTATDVLAFSLAEEGEMPLGDVYVGHEQARRQAREHGVSPAEELVRLVVHGTLHVLGHDHPEGPERSESPMYRAQEALVRAVVEPE